MTRPYNSNRNSHPELQQLLEIMPNATTVGGTHRETGKIERACNKRRRSIEVGWLNFCHLITRKRPFGLQGFILLRVGVRFNGVKRNKNKKKKQEIPPGCSERKRFSWHRAWVTSILFVILLFLLMILPQVHLRKPCYDFYFL